MSSTTTQPPPLPREGLPASLYILAATICVLGFIALVYLYFTRWFAYAPTMQQQQHRSATDLNKRILDTLPKVTWSASESEAATKCAICLTDYEYADEFKVLLTSASESEAVTKCAICLTDYEEAGEVRVLPTSVVIIFSSPTISSTFSDHFRPMSSTTTQPPPLPGEGLPQHQHGSAAALNERILDTLPKVTWSASESEATTECAICLTD
ncbi:hypothetical protein Tco_1456825 [Tanacetum coccineum]